MLKSVKFFPLIFLFSSCLLSFEQLKVTTNITCNDYFNDEFISVSTSIPLDSNSFSDNLTLKNDGSKEDIICKFEHNKFLIKPKSNWQKGNSYTFQIKGNLKTTDSRVYEVNQLHTFIYGDPHEDFKLLNFTTPKENNTDNIILKFNKAVDINSFEKNFTISPYLDLIKEYYNNNTEVHIQPKKQWNYNTPYTWKILSLKSYDEYDLIMDYSETFSIPDNIQPELQFIQTCECINLYEKDFSELHSIIDSNSDVLIKTDSTLCFQFNTEIDLSSFISNFSISPSVSGNYFQENEKVYFIPDKAFQQNTEYLIKLNRNIKAKNSLSLFQSYFSTFTTELEYLSITKICINDTPDISTLCLIENNSPVNEIDFSGTERLFLSIDFDQELSFESISNLNKIVKLENYFPKHISSPHLLSIQNVNNKSFIFEYDNLTASINQDNYYLLTIESSDLLKSNTNKTMENQICAILSLK